MGESSKGDSLSPLLSEREEEEEEQEGEGVNEDPDVSLPLDNEFEGEDGVNTVSTQQIDQTQNELSQQSPPPPPGIGESALGEEELGGEDFEYYENFLDPMSLFPINEEEGEGAGGGEGMDEEEGEAAFMAQYNEDYGQFKDEENDDVVIPLPDAEPLSVHSLDEFIRMLEKEDGNEETEVQPDGHWSDNCIDKELEDGEEESMHQMDERDKLIVLGPDHPKMQRFQRALKAHLEKQIYLAQSEHRELAGDLKLKKKEREELGIHLYNLQYELSRQSDKLEESERELEELTKSREAIDKDYEELKEQNEKLHESYKKELNEEESVMKSIKELDMMEWCIRGAVKEYESELKISQRVDEKFQKLKEMAEMEKKDQEAVMDRLMVRLQYLEQSNEGLERQVKAHMEEQKELNGFIGEATTEIEALQIEKKHLQRAWNETLNVVRSRDEALNAARKALLETNEDVKVKESTLRQLLVRVNKEQEKHERLTLKLKRKKMEERRAKSQLETINSQVASLQGSLTILNRLKDQIEEELNKSTLELSALEKVLDGPRSRINKLSAEKKRLEDEIISIIQEHSSIDKITASIARQAQEARERTRNLEDEVARIENEMTYATYECEVLRTEYLKKKSNLAELEKKLEAQEKELKKQDMQMKYSDRIIQKKNKEIEILSAKLTKLTEEQESQGLTKLEEEVEELERQVASNRQICVDLQETWLKLQDELVKLTTKRDQIMAENDLKMKESFILEQKRQRISRESEEKRGEIHKLEKNIKAIQTQISLLNSKLYEGKEEEEELEKQNALLHTELLNLLKDAEMEALELQDEITRLEGEKEGLNLEMEKHHQQCLLWEKKVRLARELKDSIKKEQETSTSQLKLSIHHMQVRHNELKRAQERLMMDLEMCIEKRERIISRADFNMRKNNIDPSKVLLNMQREEVHSKGKYMKLVKEAREAEEEVRVAQSKVDELNERIRIETDKLREVKKTIDVADTKLTDLAVEKHQHLIELILRQTKYKFMESILYNKHGTSLEVSELNVRIKELEEEAYTIVDLSDWLLKKYPEYTLPIKLIKASIITNVALK